MSVARLGFPVLALLLLPCAPAAFAAGRAIAPAPAPAAVAAPRAFPGQHMSRATVPSRGPLLSHGPAIRHRAVGGRAALRRWGGVGSYGSFWPGFLPFPEEARTVLLQDAPAEPEKRVDPNDFETMPVRMGIPPVPTPAPVIYRIEGRRDRPVTRIVRIGADDSGEKSRSRYAHAETGALLLTVPGR